MHSNQRTLQSTELPDDFAGALQELTTNGEPPATLADAVEAFDRLWDLAEVEVAVENMYQPGPTWHAVDLGGWVEHVPCLLDALIVALVVESEPVKIRSKQPDAETTIRLTVTDGEVEVEPATVGGVRPVRPAHRTPEPRTRRTAPAQATGPDPG